MTTLYPSPWPGLANLRTDISDPDAARWTDDRLTRAIDRSRERLSEVFPSSPPRSTATTAGVGDYPLPSGAWWVDSSSGRSDRWPAAMSTSPDSVIPQATTSYVSPSRPILSPTAPICSSPPPASTPSTTPAPPSPNASGTACSSAARRIAYDLYLTNVLDNFVFADGMLRDKVDDTASMASWQAQASSALANFTTRLNQVRAPSSTPTAPAPSPGVRSPDTGNRD